MKNPKYPLASLINFYHISKILHPTCKLIHFANLTCKNHQNHVFNFIHTLYEPPRCSSRQPLLTSQSRKIDQTFFPRNESQSMKIIIVLETSFQTKDNSKVKIFFSANTIINIKTQVFLDYRVNTQSFLVVIKGILGMK